MRLSRECFHSVIALFDVTDDNRSMVWYRNGSCCQAAMWAFSNVHVYLPMEVLYRLAAVVFRWVRPNMLLLYSYTGDFVIDYVVFLLKIVALRALIVRQYTADGFLLNKRDCYCWLRPNQYELLGDWLCQQGIWKSLILISSRFVGDTLNFDIIPVDSAMFDLGYYVGPVQWLSCVV